MAFDFPSQPSAPETGPEAGDGDTKMSWGEIVVTVTMTTTAVVFVAFVAVVMSLA